MGRGSDGSAGRDLDRLVRLPPDGTPAAPTRRASTSPTSMSRDVDSDVGRAARAAVGIGVGVRETTYVGVGFAVLGIQRTRAAA